MLEFACIAYMLYIISAVHIALRIMSRCGALPPRWSHQGARHGS